MELSGQLSARDYLRAQYLHLRPRRWLRIAYWALAVLFLIEGLVYLISAILGEWPWMPFLIQSAFLILFVLNFFVFLPLRSRRVFRQQRSLHEPFVFRASAAGLESSNSIGQASQPWSHFVKWKQNEHLVLLYLSDLLFIVIPKSVFSSEADAARFTELVGSQVRAAT